MSQGRVRSCLSHCLTLVYVYSFSGDRHSGKRQIRESDGHHITGSLLGQRGEAVSSSGDDSTEAETCETTWTALEGCGRSEADSDLQQILFKYVSMSPWNRI